MFCNFGSWGPNHSKFYSNMKCDLPEAYKKFQLIFRFSFWVKTNSIKHVLEENLQVLTSVH